jgi:uncharacterized membrane protein HdeD (DUF308 family)
MLYPKTGLKRGILGTVIIILGIIMWLAKEYYFGIGVIIGGIMSVIGLTSKDKLMWYIGGLYFLIGGILSFFLPPALLYAPLSSEILTKISASIMGIAFTIAGIYMILRGLKIERKDSKDN